MPQITPIARHTPETIAAEEAVTGRWIRKICKRLFGPRPVYRLTDAEREKVLEERHRWQRR